jgi:choline monooxygenase
VTLDRAASGVTSWSKPFSAQDYTREETYRQTRVPVELTTTLIPEAYTCPEFYTIEQERVFATSWIAVGCTSQLQQSGQALVVTVAGRSIFVTRDKAGRLRAFHNVCRHRGARLLDDGCQALRSVRIRCPYHSWTYDLEGHCLGTPLFEGSGIPENQRGAFDMSGAKHFDKADYGLIPAGVASWAGLIFVNLNADAPPLRAQLGDLPERFSRYRLDEWRLVRAKRYQIAANYKLIGENFMECYHLPWVHPELIKVSRLENHYRWQGPGLYTGMCTTPISQNAEAGGWQGLRPLSTLRGADAESARFIWLFPNTAMNVLPNHAFIILARPDGTGTDQRRDAHPRTPRVHRGHGCGRGAGPAGVFLGSGEPAGHRDRRAGAGRLIRPGVSRRAPVLPLRGAAPPLPEHGHRQDGRYRTRASR